MGYFFLFFCLLPTRLVIIASVGSVIETGSSFLQVVSSQVNRASQMGFFFLFFCLLPTRLVTIASVGL
jgi:hypothetical protein